MIGMSGTEGNTLVSRNKLKPNLIQKGRVIKAARLDKVVNEMERALSPPSR
jgi:hypothetical protein